LTRGNVADRSGDFAARRSREDRVLVAARFTTLLGAARDALFHGLERGETSPLSTARSAFVSLFAP
jgi:hypothetical protein